MIAYVSAPKNVQVPDIATKKENRDHRKIAKLSPGNSKFDSDARCSENGYGWNTGKDAKLWCKNFSNPVEDDRGNTFDEIDAVRKTF